MGAEREQPGLPSWQATAACPGRAGNPCPWQPTARWRERTFFCSGADASTSLPPVLQPWLRYPSVCLSAHSQLPRGAHGAKPGGAPSPGRTSEEQSCTPSTRTRLGEDPRSPRGAQGAGITPWALPPWDHVVFTRGFGDAKAQQAAAAGGDRRGATLLPTFSIAGKHPPSPKCSRPPGWGFCVLQLGGRSLPSQPSPPSPAVPVEAAVRGQGAGTPRPRGLAAEYQPGDGSSPRAALQNSSQGQNPRRARSPDSWGREKEHHCTPGSRS